MDEVAILISNKQTLRQKKNVTIDKGRIFVMIKGSGISDSKIPEVKIDRIEERNRQPDNIWRLQYLTFNNEQSN